MKKFELLKNLTSFPAAFAGIVGAPSILSLFEILLDRRFLELFAWIIDGYERILDVFGRLADFFVIPFLVALNGIFDTSLLPGEHWRPLFVLLMIFVAPHIWPVGKKSLRTLWLAFLNTIYFLYVAVVTSFLPLSPWPWQLLIAALPFAFFWIALMEDGYLAMKRRRQLGAGAHVVKGLGFGLGFCVFLAALAAFFCIFETTRSIAAVCALLTFIVLFVFGGMAGVAESRKRRVYSTEEVRLREEASNEGVLRDGCRTLSGLLLAALIVLVDFALKGFV